MSFRLQTAEYSTAYLLVTGLVSGENKTVTLKAADYASLGWVCGAIRIELNGRVTDAVKSATATQRPTARWLSLSQ